MRSLFHQSFLTDRLELHALIKSDASFIHKLTNSPGWLEFIGDRNIANESDAINYIEKIADMPEANYWKVIEKNSGNSLGVITLIKRDYLEDYDIGYAFLPSSEGKGFAFEATLAILEKAILKSTRGIIYAVTKNTNEKSIKLLEKLGLRNIKTLNQDGDIVELFQITKDQFEIDQLVRQFYNIFNNSAGNQSDWNVIHELCIPQLMVIKKSETEEFYNIEDFMSPRIKILTDGTLMEFKEWEVEGSTNIKGNIAQRASVYRKKGFLNGDSYEGSGNKFFQFVNTKQGWKISSVVWEDH